MEKGFIKEDRTIIGLGVCGSSNYCAYLEKWTNYELEEIKEVCTNSSNPTRHTGILYKITDRINKRVHNVTGFRMDFIRKKKLTGKGKTNPADLIVNKQDKTAFINPNHKNELEGFQESVKLIREAP